ncbi:IclR family transcriptional regulator [Cupriavidus oxalaticus]|uniref:IclR family transcriptional regulator n=1 Tax=Cupriavidus oxalaticus TaxID=96344 RepID=UPI003F733343
MTRATPVTLTLERGLQVLRAFRAERTPLTNSELVKRTGLSKATVSRLTTTLVSLGFLRRVAGGPRFALDAGALAMGHTYLETNPVTQLASPLMQALADRLKVSVSLAVPDQLDMLYIAQCTSARIATLRLGVGSLLPMGWTASGRAWLWGLAPDARRDYIEALKDAAGPRANEMDRGIQAAFDDLCATGVYMSDGNFQRNAYGIALPVKVGRRATLMALSCGAVALQPDVAAIRQRIVPELKSAALELVELLRDVDAQP